jgi:O-antigen ligase
MDAYTLAKAYFDVKEYDRAAHFLHGCNSKKAYFLFMYSRYLVRAILRCYFFFNEACVFNLLNSLAVGHQMNVLY